MEQGGSKEEISISIRRTVSRIESQLVHGFLPSKPSLLRSTLACVGVVWGDLGTSPLYTLTESLHSLPSVIEENQVIGVVSLIIWSMIVIVCVKYLFIVLRCDHAGEGGIFSLLQVADRPGQRIFLIAAIVGGASMIGDSLITPALSVLSAVEGLKDERIFGWSSETLTVSVTCGILTLLYALQFKGTSKIGVVFGPVVTVYFLSIAAIGIYNIIMYDGEIYKALSPFAGLKFVFTDGLIGFKVLSSVVLCVTGAEAVSADLGHFSKPPIWLSWYTLVFPALVLNYLGQGAYVLSLLPGEAVGNIFFASIPSAVYVPVWVVVTLATVVASQAMITGCFSLVSQGISLGLFPRLKTLNTDPEQRAQIFIPSVTLLLGLGTVMLVIFFKNSSKLAGAYGISVLVTFLMTDVVLTGALARKFRGRFAGKARWVLAAAAVTPFMMIDGVFLSANVYEKIAHGGWLPLAIGAVLVAMMLSWRYGRLAATKENHSKAQTGETTAALLAEIDAEKISRNSGVSGVFLSPIWKDGEVLPSSLRIFRNVTGSVPEICVFLTVSFDKEKPFLSDSDRTEHKTLGAGLFALQVNFGYAEPLTELTILTLIVTYLNSQNAHTDTNSLWFFLHAEDVSPKPSRRIWSKLVLWFYVALLKVSASAADFFGLPPQKVVLLGNSVTL